MEPWQSPQTPTKAHGEHPLITNGVWGWGCWSFTKTNTGVRPNCLWGRWRHPHDTMTGPGQVEPSRLAQLALKAMWFYWCQNMCNDAGMTCPPVEKQDECDSIFPQLCWTCLFPSRVWTLKLIIKTKNKSSYSWSTGLVQRNSPALWTK